MSFIEDFHSMEPLCNTPRVSLGVPHVAHHVNANQKLIRFPILQC